MNPEYLEFINRLPYYVKRVLMLNIVCLLLAIIVLSVLVAGLGVYLLQQKQQEKQVLFKQEEQLLKQQIIQWHKRKNAVIPINKQDIVLLVNKYFPTKDELPNLLLDINQLAMDHQLKVISIIPQEAIAINDEKMSMLLKKLMEQNLAITMIGHYLDLLQMINGLMKMQHIVAVKQLEIMRTKADDSSNLTAFIQLKMYFIDK